MEPSLEDLLKYFKKNNEEYLYTVAATIYDSEVIYEIMHGSQDGKEKGWKIKKLDTEEWENVEDIVQKFNDLKLTIMELHVTMYKTLVTKAYYHDLMFKNIEKIVGKEAIDIVKQEFENFRKNLLDLVSKTLDIKKKETFTLIKGEKEN